jgi:hypothetical protein
MEGKINSRLQKGGALTGDMRMLVQHWKEPAPAISEIHTILGKQTLARSKDTFNRAFKPRFLEGEPENSWTICLAAEAANADIGSIRDLYYYLTAKSEFLLYKYVTEELYSLFLQGIWDIKSNDTVIWIKGELEKAGLSWTETIQKKVARGLLAALRDFSILEGRTSKRILPPTMQPNTACFIAWILHEHFQLSGRAIKESEDWRLFLLSQSSVERIFLEAHQLGYLHYQSAGSTVRIEFPTRDLETYARQLFQ